MVDLTLECVLRESSVNMGICLGHHESPRAASAFAFMTPLEIRNPSDSTPSNSLSPKHCSEVTSRLLSVDFISICRDVFFSELW